MQCVVYYYASYSDEIAKVRYRLGARMMPSSVLLLGLGDLGQRVLDALSRVSGIDRLVVCSRNGDTGREHVAQASLVSRLSGDPKRVEYLQLDLRDADRLAEVLRTIDATVIVMAASHYTWWRSPATTSDQQRALAELPYGTWLPLHVPLVRSLMEARRSAGVRGRVVCLPYPDVVGAVLAPLGLAPDIGAGNVAEVAAKLATLAGGDTSRADVHVRLVMHHAVERLAFRSFRALGGPTNGDQDGTETNPPWLAEVRIGDVEMSRSQVDGLVRSPYPLPSGNVVHRLTSAATVNVVRALLPNNPWQLTHRLPMGCREGIPCCSLGISSSWTCPPA
ncbi:MAG: KR domain-containing protein [Chloroflexota bacterium]